MIYPHKYFYDMPLFFKCAIFPSQIMLVLTIALNINKEKGYARMKTCMFLTIVSATCNFLENN